MKITDLNRLLAKGLYLLALLWLYQSFSVLAAVDLIIHNAAITTQNPGQPQAQAVAIQDGLIFRVGDNSDILKLRTSGSKVIDAGGRRLIPGLNDSHLHAVRGGRFYNLELRWEGVPSLKEGLEMIREQAKHTPKGQWIRVIGGWSPYQFKEKRLPTVAELNEAAPHTPVFVLFLYSRGFLNQAGLKALDITAKTQAPPGSRYELGPDGAPTGVLIADPSPVILYQTIARLPPLSEADQANSTRQFYRELTRFGITSVIDAGGGGHEYPTDYTGSLALANSGELPLRVSFYLFPQHPGHEHQEFENWMKQTVPGRNQHTSLMHGYEAEGGGEFITWKAGDYENFMSPRPTQVSEMEADFDKTLRLLVRNRWPFRIHATYGESVTRILNVLEKINREIPFDGLRWAIDHAETVSAQDIARIKTLGGGIAIQNRMAFAGEYFKERYGAEATATAPPLREMLLQGVPVGVGTDGTRVSSYNPWISLAWMVTGKSVGGEPLLNAHNRLSRAEALRLYTLGSAWFSNEESVKGRIAPGQFADLALLSDDYFAVADERIGSIESVLTVVGGKITFGAGSYVSHAPAAIGVTPVWSPVNRFGGHWASK